MTVPAVGDSPPTRAPDLFSALNGLLSQVVLERPALYRLSQTAARIGPRAEPLRWSFGNRRRGLFVAVNVGYARGRGYYLVVAIVPTWREPYEVVMERADDRLLVFRSQTGSVHLEEGELSLNKLAGARLYVRPATTP